MLLILTGDIQTGKTRWLQRLVEDLDARGVVCQGVIAPGDWVASTGPHADANGFEKRGITNVLLPQGEPVPFALRRDLAQSQGLDIGKGQSGRAGLGWHIFDGAICTVNEHFARLRAQDEAGEPLASSAVSDRAAESGAAGLLLVDELGRLELMRGEGLTEAMRILDAGPRPRWPHALVIVRESLCPLAEERFAEVWGGCQRIYPDEASCQIVFALMPRGWSLDVSGCPGAA